MKSYNSRRRPRPSLLPRHRRFTTLPGSGPQNPEDLALTPFAGFAATAEDRFPPSPRRKNWHLEWPAALLLHAAVIALALISFRPRLSLQQQSQSQTPVSIVVENSGSRQTVAPPSPRQGPPVLAQVPPAPSAVPPPPAPAPQQPEMDLEIPEDLFSQEELPPAAPPQQSRVQNARPVRRYARPTHRQYQVMNNMSLGNGSSGNPAPPMPNAKRGLNLQLSQSDLNALNRPEITVQGEIGSDWMASFNKWVNAHIYYPQAAIEQNQQGTSVIRFTVHRDGSVTGLQLLSSAGSPFLDQAWLGVFKDNDVPPFPPGTKSDTIQITGSLEYELIR